MKQVSEITVVDSEPSPACPGVVVNGPFVVPQVIPKSFTLMLSDAAVMHMSPEEQQMFQIRADRFCREMIEKGCTVTSWRDESRRSSCLTFKRE